VLGAASALVLTGVRCLHIGYAKAVFHRDARFENILLEKNLLAKVSYFGLSKTGPELD